MNDIDSLDNFSPPGDTLSSEQIDVLVRLILYAPESVEEIFTCFDQDEDIQLLSDALAGDTVRTTTELVKSPHFISELADCFDSYREMLDEAFSEEGP